MKDNPLLYPPKYDALEYVYNTALEDLLEKKRQEFIDGIYEALDKLACEHMKISVENWKKLSRDQQVDFVTRAGITGYRIRQESQFLTGNQRVVVELEFYTPKE